MIEMVKLGDVVSTKSKKPQLNDDMDVSFINMATLPIKGRKFSHNNTSKVFEVKKGYTYFEENDVLLAKITPCFENGKCGVATNLKNNTGFGSTEFIVLRAKSSILPYYIYFIISDYNFINNGKNFMTGTAGQQRVPVSYVENLQIPLPPIETQQKIVDELEKIEETIKQMEDIIKQEQEKFDCVLNELFYE